MFCPCYPTLADVRYKGFSTLLDSFRRLGLLSSDRIGGVEDWDQFLINSAGGIVGQQINKGDMSSVMRDILGSRQEETEEALRWSVLIHGDKESEADL
jgi:alpha-aminoadipic semialdehyde synthase